MSFLVQVDGYHFALLVIAVHPQQLGYSCFQTKTNMYIYIYVYVYTCIYIYIYIYIEREREKDLVVC